MAKGARSQRGRLFDFLRGWRRGLEGKSCRLDRRQRRAGGGFISPSNTVDEEVRLAGATVGLSYPVMVLRDGRLSAVLRPRFRLLTRGGGGGGQKAP